MSAGPCLSGNSHQSLYSSAYCRHRRFKNWRCANKCSFLPLDISFYAEPNIDVYAATTADLIIATNENGGGGAYFLGRGVNPTSSIYHFPSHYLMLLVEDFLMQWFFGKCIDFFCWMKVWWKKLDILVYTSINK